MSKTYEVQPISSKFQPIYHSIMGFVGRAKPPSILSWTSIMLIKRRETSFPTSNIPETYGPITGSTGKDVGLRWRPTDGDNEAELMTLERVG